MYIAMIKLSGLCKILFMKKNLWMSALLALSVMSSQSQDNILNVMTFNIRYNNAKDSINAWPNRKEFAASQIAFHQAHIVGLQEALNGQLLDLEQSLPNYKYLGVGRDDGKTKGEYSAVLYDSLRLQAIKSETFWLSETPQVPGSKSWDAAITRVVTWVLFKDRKTKKQFYLFNTHFDHVGKVARKSSATILLNKVKEIANGKTAIITGDFNAHPSDEPIQVIMDAGNPLRFTDSKAISQQPHYGPTGTFNAFTNKETSDQPIDYIFIKGKATVLQHATLSQTWQGRFSSDHFPVLARIVL